MSADARFVARSELQYLLGTRREPVLDDGGAHVVKDHGHAGAMQQPAQIGRLDVAALEARDLLRKQRGDHRLAPQVGHLDAEVGGGEHLALARATAKAMLRISRMPSHAMACGSVTTGDAARIQRGVRDAHDLAGERDVALDQLREFGGACVRRIGAGSFAAREAHDFGYDLRRRRQLQRIVRHGRVQNAVEIGGSGRSGWSVHGVS